jgi:hypothetical protein
VAYHIGLAMLGQAARPGSIMKGRVLLLRVFAWPSLVIDSASEGSYQGYVQFFFLLDS